MKMIRKYVATNIRLPEEIHKMLRLRALQEGKSVSQLMREAAEHLLQGAFNKDLPEKEYRKDSFFKLAGFYADGVRDGSANHDHMLYGEDN
ncbi:MAG: ribbon-helix-helix domain-containing protein [bacterium]